MVKNNLNEVPEMETTTIRIRKSTKARLEEIGKMSDSFDELISRLIDSTSEAKAE
jgi:hypothetical protein